MTDRVSTDSSDRSPVERLGPPRLEPVRVGLRRSSLSGRALTHARTRICHRTGSILALDEAVAADDGFEFRPGSSGGWRRRLRLQPPRARRFAWLPEPGFHRPGLAVRGTAPWWPAALVAGGLGLAWAGAGVVGTGIATRLGAGPALTTAVDAIIRESAGPIGLVAGGGLLVYAAATAVTVGRDRRRRHGPVFAPAAMKAEIVWTIRESLAIDGATVTSDGRASQATLTIKAKPEPRDTGPLRRSGPDDAWNAGWLVIDVAPSGPAAPDHSLLPRPGGRAVPLRVPPIPDVPGKDGASPVPRPAPHEFERRQWFSVAQVELLEPTATGVDLTTRSETVPAGGTGPAPDAADAAFVDRLDPLDPPVPRDPARPSADGLGPAAPVDPPGVRFRLRRRLDAPAWLDLEVAAALPADAAPNRIDHEVELTLDDEAERAGLRFSRPGSHGRIAEDGRVVRFVRRTTGDEVAAVAGFSVRIERRPAPGSDPSAAPTGSALLALEPEPWTGRCTGKTKVTVHDWIPSDFGAGPEDLSLFLPTGTPRAIDPDDPATDGWPKQELVRKTVFESACDIDASSIVSPLRREVQLPPRHAPADPQRGGATGAVQRLADRLGAAGIAVLAIEHRLPVGARPDAASTEIGANEADDGTWDLRCVSFGTSGSAVLSPISIEIRASGGRTRRGLGARPADVSASANAGAGAGVETGPARAPAGFVEVKPEAVTGRSGPGTVYLAGEVAGVVHGSADATRLRRVADHVDTVLRQMEHAEATP